jgi:hypothetical protein
MKKALRMIIVSLLAVALLGAMAAGAWGAQTFAVVTDPATGKPIPGFSNAYFNPGDNYAEVYDSINHVWVTVFLVTGPDGTVTAILPLGYFESFENDFSGEGGSTNPGGFSVMLN